MPPMGWMPLVRQCQLDPPVARSPGEICPPGYVPRTAQAHLLRSWAQARWPPPCSYKKIATMHIPNKLPCMSTGMIQCKNGPQPVLKNMATRSLVKWLLLFWENGHWQIPTAMWPYMSAAMLPFGPQEILTCTISIYCFIQHYNCD